MDPVDHYLQMKIKFKIKIINTKVNLFKQLNLKTKTCEYHNYKNFLTTTWKNFDVYPVNKTSKI